MFAVLLLHFRKPSNGMSGMEVFRVQVIRGPRPPSVQWPRLGQQQQIVQQNQRPVQVRTPQNQVKTSGEDVGIRPFVDPSVKLAAAKERVVKLEIALAAMVWKVPRSSVCAVHKQEAVQGVLLNIQIKECESFLSRATSYSEELDTKRAVICQNIEMSKKRLEELKAQSVSPPFRKTGLKCSI